MKKKPVIITLILIIVLVLQFTKILPIALANVTSYIYIQMHYKEKNIQHYSTEYDTHFGEYIVNYRDGEGDQFSFIISPSFFPVIVSHDPFSKNP